MSQTSSTFDKAILRGFLFCLKHQGLSPIEAHSALLQFTKTEIFTVEEITELFNRNYRPKKTLFLIENGILNENAPEKFLTSVAEAGLQDIDTLRLLEIFRTVSTDPYSLETVETYLRAELDQKKLIIGKNFISGFLICLHRQNYKIEDSYEKLKATTGIEIEIGEVKKIYAEIAKGDYYDGILNKDYQKLFTVIPEVMERIVKYADLETRKNLAQTSIPFNRIALRPIIIKRLDVSFVPDTIRIDVDSDPKRSYHRVRRSNFNPNPLKGCVTQVGGDIWLDPSKEIDYEAEGMLAWISRRAQTIETMELLVYNRPCNPRNLPVVNLYTNLDSLEPFVPGVLKKVVQHTINGRISLATDSEQWNQLESFHAFGFFPDFDTVWPRSLHLKYGMFGIWERVTVEQVIRMKDDLLQNPEIQEREVNVMMSREEIDRLNDTLHTYNTTETIHPMSVGFLYPHDRQRILLMNVKSHSINENRNAVCCVNFTGFTLSGQTRAAKHYYFRIREWVHRQALRHDEDN